MIVDLNEHELAFAGNCIALYRHLLTGNSAGIARIYNTNAHLGVEDEVIRKFNHANTLGMVDADGGLV
jgi:hypothetical protein